MRIVGGSLRGRRLAAPPGNAIRPTSDRAREGLFNRLVHGAFSNDGTSSVAGASVLDAFCGTGALGLEALSRGAAHATFLDRDPAAILCTSENIEALGVVAQTIVLRGDATTPPQAPPRASASCDLIFMDAPYAQAVSGTALEALAAAGWMKPGALCVCETKTGDHAPDEAPGFTVLDSRTYGKAQFTFLRYDPA